MNLLGFNESITNVVFLACIYLKDSDKLFHQQIIILNIFLKDSCLLLIFFVA